MSEVPINIEELKKRANIKTSYKLRIEAVEQLGEYKCQQSKDILWRLMMNDKVYAVQELAFRKLQAFGEDVKLPKKKKGDLIKDIKIKLGLVKKSFNSEFTIEEYGQKFKKLYPFEYDVYSFEKGEKLNDWLLKVVNTLPNR